MSDEPSRHSTLAAPFGFVFLRPGFFSRLLIMWLGLRPRATGLASLGCSPARGHGMLRL